MNISERKSKAFLICIGVAFLCISFVSATVSVYMKDGTALEEGDEDTLIADYLAINEGPQRIILFSDPNCGGCKELRPWLDVFEQAYPDIVEEYEINLEENEDILNECKIAFSHDRVLTPSIFVEGVDGSGFVLEGVESIELYLEALVVGMYEIDDIFDEDELVVIGAGAVADAGISE
jgi:thiol-disulfide isomerase/thioredoxin